MKNRLLKCFLLILSFAVIPIFSLQKTEKDVVFAAEEKKTVYLCGFAAGFEVRTVGATVIKLTDVVTEKGVISPSKNAGINEGDVIMKIGDVDIFGADDVGRALEKGGEIVITIKRDGETVLKTVTPAQDVSGKNKLGVILRDGTSGIGTMTYITKDRRFMALGHPVCHEDGEPLKVAGGKIFRCSVFGVNKAERGKAGELKGMFISDAPIGEINGNYAEGIGGVVTDSFDLSAYPEIEVGVAEPGKATIVTCVDGVVPKEYSVAIVKSDKSRDSKNLVVKVTDKELLSSAGGIVQGMSGSPIVQSGKLVGAITHVFVNDPTRGYGISIDNMLNAK